MPPRGQKPRGQPKRVRPIWLLVAALFLYRFLPTFRSCERAVDPGSGWTDGRRTGWLQGGAWALPPGPAHVDGLDLPILFLAMASSNYQDLMMNWVECMKLIQAPFVLGTVDEDTLQLVKQLKLPYIHVDVELSTEESYEGHYDRIRAVGAAKVGLARRLLQQGAAQHLVVSDTDIAWVKNPLPYVLQRPLADWFHSTDCLSAKAEASWGHPDGAGVVRCGHLPGSHWFSAWNGGLYIIRNRRASLAFLEAWEGALTHPPSRSTQGWVIDDQFSLNVLLQEGAEPMREVEEHEQEYQQLVGGQQGGQGMMAGSLRPRVKSKCVWVANNTLRLHPLPVLHFANGHVGFLQHLPERYEVQPFMIHSTFTPLGARGKRARFRESGLWHVDPPSYYRGRFLTYDNQVRRYMQQYNERWEEEHGSPMVTFHLHLVAMAWQRGAMRDALAIARLLKRTLVLPPLWCWCDVDQTPDVLEACTIIGSDMQLPFNCPADALVDPNLWEDAGVDYRAANFLSSPHLDPNVALSSWANVQVTGGNVGGSQRSLLVADHFGARQRLGRRRKRKHQQQQQQHDKDTDNDKNKDRVQLQGEGSAIGSGWAVAVQAGDDGRAVEAALAPVSGAAVVAVQGMGPGVFGGFGDAALDQEFDQWFLQFAMWASWCCGGANGSAPNNVFQFDPPRRLAMGWQPWQPPVIYRPSWCDQVEEVNRQYTQYANHPCSFGLVAVQGTPPAPRIEPVVLQTEPMEHAGHVQVME